MEGAGWSLGRLQGYRGCVGGGEGAGLSQGQGVEIA